MSKSKLANFNASNDGELADRRRSAPTPRKAALEKALRRKEAKRRRLMEAKKEE